MTEQNSLLVPGQAVEAVRPFCAAARILAADIKHCAPAHSQRETHDAIMQLEDSLIGLNELAKQYDEIDSNDERVYIGLRSNINGARQAIIMTLNRALAYCGQKTIDDHEPPSLIVVRAEPDTKSA